MRSLMRGPTKASDRPLAARYRRRRLAAALFGVVALLVVVVLGTRVLLYDAGLANVEDLTVTGVTTVPEQAVRDAAAVSPGGPLISVDTAGIASRVAALEGVASVTVRRAWPHTVEVDVTERVPVALWQSPAGLYEVDTTGLSYRRAPDPPPALPRLTFAGVGPQDPATTAAITVLRDLTDPLRAQVATVAVAGTQVTLGLVDDRSVRWGDPERSSTKWPCSGHCSASRVRSTTSPVRTCPPCVRDPRPSVTCDTAGTLACTPPCQGVAAVRRACWTGVHRPPTVPRRRPGTTELDRPNPSPTGRCRA